MVPTGAWKSRNLLGPLVVLLSAQAALLGLYLALSPVSAETSDVSDEPALLGQESTQITELGSILGLSESELEGVSISRINLLVAKEIFPGLNVEAYEAKLKGLAQDVRMTIAKYGIDPKDPDQGIRAINTTLYLEKELKYAKLGSAQDVVYLNQDPRNLFLNGLLDRMTGTCISMPVLYIALGEELGYPIYGVNAGDHMFCRWDDGTFMTNIEPTGGGGWSPDEDYIRDMEVTDKQLKTGAYMRTLTKRGQVQPGLRYSDLGALPILKRRRTE